MPNTCLPDNPSPRDGENSRLLKKILLKIIICMGALASFRIPGKKVVLMKTHSQDTVQMISSGANFRTNMASRAVRNRPTVLASSKKARLTGQIQNEKLLGIKRVDEKILGKNRLARNQPESCSRLPASKPSHNPVITPM